MAEEGVQEIAGPDLYGGGGEDGEALLGRQDLDEAQDEQLHGDALEGGEQRQVIGQRVHGAVHVSHALQAHLHPSKGPSARPTRNLGVSALRTRYCTKKSGLVANTD